MWDFCTTCVFYSQRYINDEYTNLFVSFQKKKLTMLFILLSCHVGGPTKDINRVSNRTRRRKVIYHHINRVSNKARRKRHILKERNFFYKWNMICSKDIFEDYTKSSFVFHTKSFWQQWEMENIESQATHAIKKTFKI